MRYYALYKCRLCGIVMEIRDQELTVLATMHLASPYPYTRDDILQAEPLALVARHECDMHTLALADFIGWRREV